MLTYKTNMGAQMKFQKEEAPFNEYGGGGGGGAPHQDFYYLVINGEGQTTSSEEIQNFYRTGINSQSNDIFVFVDVGTDNRLRDDLDKLPGGAELYESIVRQAPVFITTPMRIPMLTDLAKVHLHPITSYETDLDFIYKKFRHTGWRVRTAATMKQVNAYLQLKPSFFGIGLNLNEMLADLIRQLEQN